MVMSRPELRAVLMLATAVSAVDVSGFVHIAGQSGLADTLVQVFRKRFGSLTCETESYKLFHKL
jgi:hypothetical protein